MKLNLDIEVGDASVNVDADFCEVNGTLDSVRTKSIEIHGHRVTRGVEVSMFGTWRRASNHKKTMFALSDELATEKLEDFDPFAYAVGDAMESSFNHAFGK